MTALRTAFVLVLALALSGCFQTQLTLRLNADGSGTLEERVLMNSTMAMAVMMGGMGAMMGTDQEAPDMPDGPYSMEALEARAASLGATLQGVEPIEVLFGGGYAATYAFDDIADLRLDADPTASLPEEIGEDFGGDDDDEPAQRFAFAYDGQTFTVQIPRPENEEDEAATDGRDPKKDPMDDEEGGRGGPSERDFQQAAIVLRDMRFGLTVELPKDVAQTNASHLAGRTLTIYDLDFGAMLADPNAFESLDAINMDDGPPNLGGDAAALAQIPGMTLEIGPTVTVTFE